MVMILRGTGVAPYRKTKGSKSDNDVKYDEADKKVTATNSKLLNGFNISTAPPQVCKYAQKLVAPFLLLLKSVNTHRRWWLLFGPTIQIFMMPFGMPWLIQILYPQPPTKSREHPF